MGEWRLLLSGPGEAGYNMALDEALSIAVRRGWSGPTLRIYRWKEPVISLGCHQPVEVLGRFSDLNPRTISVVRRPTGGGAVGHGTDTCYALTGRRDILFGTGSGSASSTLRTLYGRFHEALSRTLGYRADKSSYSTARCRTKLMPQDGVCFQQPVCDDLMRGDRKVAGAAQRSWRDGFLQQGSVLEDDCSSDRAALAIRQAWSETFHQKFSVGTLTVQERVLVDELWSKYQPWMPSSWPPVSRGASNRSH